MQLLGALGKLAKHKLTQADAGRRCAQAHPKPWEEDLLSPPHGRAQEEEQPLPRPTRLSGSCYGALPRSSIPLLPLLAAPAAQLLGAHSSQ